jgi:arylsulfatase A-like enzyme
MNVPAFLLISCLLLLPSAADDQPNILLILADDMGYGDLGITGSETIKTPNLDRLAKSGVFCSNGYVASPVCSPSRAGLITGRDPRRFGYEGNLNAASSNYATRPELLGLVPGEHTLGDHLKAAGYDTALIGKWHLGKGELFHPNKRGFDHFCGMLGGGHGYFLDGKNNQLERNGEPLTEFSSPYITDFFTDETIDWTTDRKKPWFAFLSYNAPHTPMHAKEEDLKRYAHIKDQKRRTYCAMMHALDVGVGRMIKHLEDTNQRDNTLIVFFSDNGGATSNASWNGILSGAKGSLKEGGVRIPMFWSWPGTIPAEANYNAPASSLDLLPTFLAAAEAEPLPLSAPRSHEDKGSRKRATSRYGAYDGIDLLTHFKNGTTKPDRTLFWRLQGQSAVLHGPDKLIKLSHRPAQLFAPATDPAEITDRAASEEATLLSLFKILGEWESTLPTVPLWGSSPRWSANSARIYDTWAPRPEPR